MIVLFAWVYRVAKIAFGCACAVFPCIQMYGYDTIIVSEIFLRIRWMLCLFDLKALAVK
jgi:hypothetical protein